MPRSVGTLPLLVAGLCVAFLVTACSRWPESVCATPILTVTPEKVAPGDSVTIAWDGVVDCEGETLFPQGIAQLSLGD
jgi:hypothetical protein